MIALLLSCAALLALPPTEVIPGRQDTPDPWAGEAPCWPGTWTVACTSCTPPWSRQVTVACVGEGPETWEADLVEAAMGGRGELEAERGARPGEDWTINLSEDITP